MTWVPFPNSGSGGLNPGIAYQIVNYGPSGGSSGYPDGYVNSSPSVFLSTASGGVQSYGGFTSGGGSPATTGILNLGFASSGVVIGNFNLTLSPTFTPPGYSWYAPIADASGCLQSPGGGTPVSPSQLFIASCLTAAITSFNSQTGSTQTMQTGTAGTDFGISSAGNVHTFNLPITDATHTGKLSATDWSIFNAKANYGGTQFVVPTGSATAGTLEDGSMFDDKTHYVQSPNGVSTEASGLAETIYPNDNPGTVQYDPVCLHNAGGVTKAFDCGTTNTSGLAGIAVEGAGTTGSVRYCVTYCPANFDNTAVPGDIAIKSTTTTGLHDTGGTTNVPGVDQFIVATAAGGPGGIPTVEFWTPRNQSVAANGGGGGGGKSSLEINGSLTQQSVNLNNTTPPAQADHTNCLLQSSNSGATTSASVECPYASSSAFGVVKVDGTTITAINGVISSAGSGLTDVVQPPDLFGCTTTGTVETCIKQVQGSGQVLRSGTSGTHQTPYVNGGAGVVCFGNAVNNASCTYPGVPTGSLMDVAVFATASASTWPGCTNGDGGTITGINVSDGVNTYTAIDSYIGGGANQNVKNFYAKNVRGGALTVTASLTGTTAAACITVVLRNIVGLDTSAPLDVHTQNNGTPIGGVTTTFASDIVTGIELGDYSSNLTATAGWSASDPFTNDLANGASTFGVFQNELATGTYTPGVDNHGTALRWGFTVAYKAALNGGGNVPPYMGPLDPSFIPQLFVHMAGRSGVTASGSSCAITAITDGLITGATCSP
jgi:hypothetical protein